MVGFSHGLIRSILYMMVSFGGCLLKGGPEYLGVSNSGYLTEALTIWGSHIFVNPHLGA